MLDLAKIIAAASVKKFTYGLAYQLNDYTADGTIFDYMAGKRKVCIIYSNSPADVLGSKRDQSNSSRSPLN